MKQSQKRRMGEDLEVILRSMPNLGALLHKTAQ
jgi:hypothetical protein